MADEENKIFSNVTSKCRFVQSPFVDIEDTAYRILLHKYGVDLSYSKAIPSTLVTKEYFRLQEHVNTASVYQVRMESSVDSLIESARILKENGAFALDILTSEDNPWNNILSIIKDVSSKISIRVACKVYINFDDVEQTIQKIEQLGLAGCKVVLLHGCSSSGSSPTLFRKHWDTVKKIRSSTSIECILVEIHCSSLREVEQCLEYTSVQGVAISDPLLWNPAFFSNKQISTLEMIRDYIGLCEDCATPLTTAKMHIDKFSGYFLKRFLEVKRTIDAATTYQDITTALDTLEHDMAQLSKKRVKAFEKLQLKKEKHRISKLKRKGLQNDSPTNNSGCSHVSKRDVKQEQRERAMAALKTGQRVAIDLSLEQHMSDKEITKVAGQVRRLYGSNLRASNPFHLYFTGLEKNGRIYKECKRQNNGFDNYLVEMHEKPTQELFDSQSVVYLSPDSTNVLDELDSSKVYVIGGLVDHQVLKGVSLNNADLSQINTARLPLDEYMEKTTSGNHSYSRVLAVNQVFDILLNFHETSNWTQALLAGVPKRKGFQPRNSQHSDHQ